MINMSFKIGFTSNIGKENERKEKVVLASENTAPKRSVVEVHFPGRGIDLSYYNDKFDLKIGDLVYVDGKLEGKLGRVVGGGQKVAFGVFANFNGKAFAVAGAVCPIPCVPGVFGIGQKANNNLVIHHIVVAYLGILAAVLGHVKAVAFGPGALTGIGGIMDGNVPRLHGIARPGRRALGNELFFNRCQVSFLLIAG